MPIRWATIDDTGAFRGWTTDGRLKTLPTTEGLPAGWEKVDLTDDVYFEAFLRKWEEHERELEKDPVKTPEKMVYVKVTKEWNVTGEGGK